MPDKLSLDEHAAAVAKWSDLWGPRNGINGSMIEDLLAAYDAEHEARVRAEREAEEWRPGRDG